MGLDENTEMSNHEVTVFDYKYILQDGIDVAGVVAISNMYCIITDLFANISIVQTDNGELDKSISFHALNVPVSQNKTMCR